MSKASKATVASTSASYAQFEKALVKASAAEALRAIGLEPLEYKVLVRPVEESGAIELKGGFKLLKPDETKERDQHAAMEGEVIAISPLAFKYEENAPKPDVGDTVVFARYSGVNVKGNDGRDYRAMNDKDVILIRRAG